jgi:hypothetical protein
MVSAMRIGSRPGGVEAVSTAGQREFIEYEIPVGGETTQGASL